MTPKVPKTGDDLFVAATALWDSGKKRRAFALFRRAAQGGHASAQHNLGYFYDEGIGTKQNKKLALVWYRKAWRAGRQGDTCINIARVYKERGNRRQAVAWLERAIRRGDGEAALELAKLFDTPRDRGLQRKLLRKAVRSRHMTGDGRIEAQKLLSHQAKS